MRAEAEKMMGGLFEVSSPTDDPIAESETTHLPPSNTAFVSLVRTCLLALEGLLVKLFVGK